MKRKVKLYCAEVLWGMDRAIRARIVINTSSGEHSVEVRIPRSVCHLHRERNVQDGESYESLSLDERFVKKLETSIAEEHPDEMAEWGCVELKTVPVSEDRDV